MVDVVLRDGMADWGGPSFGWGYLKHQARVEGNMDGWMAGKMMMKKH